MQDLLRDTDDNDLGPAISHFFNCFFGTCQAVGIKVSANGPHSRAAKKVCPQKINSHSFLVTVLCIIFGSKMLSATSQGPMCYVDHTMSQI
jgi:hypothetical protein